MKDERKFQIQKERDQQLEAKATTEQAIWMGELTDQWCEISVGGSHHLVDW
jgi:hypothetical protein